MATILTDANLKKFNSELESLGKNIKDMQSHCKSGENLIYNSVGKRFQKDYTKGGQVVKTMASIINILQGLSTDLKGIQNVSKTYYNNALAASKTKK